MIKYNPKLKDRARSSRSQMTDGERALWTRLRRKQVELGRVRCLGVGQHWDSVRGGRVGKPPRGGAALASVRACLPADDSGTLSPTQ